MHKLCVRVSRYIIGADYAWPHWPTITCIYKICHLHIIHKALYLPPKILHNLCFSLLLGITATPREIENNACAKFEGWGGQIRHIMGNVQVGYELFYDWPSGWTLDLCWYFLILLLELKSVLEFLKIKKRMFFQKKRARKLTELHINTFCLCLSVVKDWVRKKCFTHKPFRRYWKRIQYGCCWRSLSLSSSSIAVFQTVYWRKCGE